MDEFGTISIPFSDRGASLESAREHTRSGKWSKQLSNVYWFVYSFGDRGAACFEVEDELHLLHQSAGPLLWALTKAGYLEKIGDKKMRKHNIHTGRSVGVWRVTCVQA